MIFQIDNINELKNKINEYDKEEYLFRGQTNNYSTDEFNYSFLTSFERVECIPNNQFKWNYYSHLILETFSKMDLIKNLNDNDKLIYVEALMQHYGWRSTFIDLSKNPLVSLFFSGYKFTQKNIISGTKDSFENFLFEFRYEAKYEVSDNDYGFLYVIDKSKILDLNLEILVDLKTRILNENFRPIRQSGFLLSNKNGMLNKTLKESIVQVLKIKKDVIIDICIENNITMNYLFPNNNIDEIYHTLLSLPRKKIEEKDIFVKPFNIPEYDIKYRKFQTPEVAYYSTTWIKDFIFEIIENLEISSNQQSDEILNAVEFRCLRDFTFHKYSNLRSVVKCEELINYLRKYKSILIEYDNIFKHPSLMENHYQKAILINLKDNIVSIKEVALQVIGKFIAGLSVHSPKHYEIIDEISLKEIKHQDDCKCENEERHFHLLDVAVFFFDAIKNNAVQLKKVEDKLFYVYNS